MCLKFIFFPSNTGCYLFAAGLALAIFPLHATARQNVNCVYKGGSRHIFIEYSGSGCRTLYNSGNGHHKEIAWAKSNLHLCKEVASGIMAKSGQSSWACDPAIAGGNTHRQATPMKSYKKAGQRSSGDYAILKSSER